MSGINLSSNIKSVKKNALYKNHLWSIILPAFASALAVLLIPVLIKIPKFANNALALIACVAIGFFVPRIREFLFTTVIFGVMFFAGQRALDEIHRASTLSWVLTDSYWIGLFQWLLITVFASLAAFGQAFRKQQLWPKRCYFLAIGSYFGGLAVGYILNQQWIETAALSIITLFCVYGAIFLPVLVSHTAFEETPNVEASDNVVTILSPVAVTEIFPNKKDND